MSLLDPRIGIFQDICCCSQDGVITRTPLSRWARNKHHPHSHGHAPNTLPFRGLRPRRKRGFRVKDLVAQAKCYKRWQTDKYKWPVLCAAISPLIHWSLSKSPSLSRPPASSYGHLGGSNAATDLSFRTRADNLHIIILSSPLFSFSLLFSFAFSILG